MTSSLFDRIILVYSEMRCVRGFLVPPHASATTRFVFTTVTIQTLAICCLEWMRDKFPHAQDFGTPKELMGGARATSVAQSVGQTDSSKATAAASAKAEGGGTANAAANATAHEDGDAEATADAVASGVDMAEARAKALADGFDCGDIANRASAIATSSGGTASGEAYSYAKV